MTMTDPISDMLTRIRNAVLAKKAEVVVPFSRIKFEIAKILENEKFIEGAQSLEKENQFKIILKYDAGSEPIIRNLKRISKPGQRVYTAKENLPKVLGGLGIAIISTSEGLMTAKEAKKRGLGGEVICEIY
jgi:small subunit ribosomal protein S8